MSESGTGLTKLFKAFGNGNTNGGSKLPAMVLALLAGAGGTIIGSQTKVEVHGVQIQQLQKEVTEMKADIKEILRRVR